MYVKCQVPLDIAHTWRDVQGGCLVPGVLGEAVTRISHLSTTKIMRSRSAAKIIYLMLPKYSEDKKSYVGDTILNNSFVIPCVNSS